MCPPSRKAWAHPQNTISTCRNPAISSTPSTGRLRKYRSRTSEVIAPAMTRVASPPRRDAAFDAPPITDRGP